jgi:hypothetical protein
MKACASRDAIGRRIRPVRIDAVVVAVRDESAPKPCDCIIVQADVIASDRSTRKTGQDNGVGVPLELVANRAHRTRAIGNGFINIPPPSGGVLLVASDRLDEGQTKPDIIRAAGNAIAQIAPLNRSRTGVTAGVVSVSIPGILDDYWIETSAIPVHRKIKCVVDSVSSYPELTCRTRCPRAGSPAITFGVSKSLRTEAISASDGEIENIESSAACEPKTSSESARHVEEKSR